MVFPGFVLSCEFQVWNLAVLASNYHDCKAHFTAFKALRFGLGVSDLFWIELLILCWTGFDVFGLSGVVRIWLCGLWQKCSMTLWFIEAGPSRLEAWSLGWRLVHT